MSYDGIIGIISAVAPSVAKRIIETIGTKRIKINDINLALLALNVETNQTNQTLLNNLCNKLLSMESCINSNAEILGTLERRTRSLRSE